MKKLISLLCCLAMALSLFAACGSTTPLETTAPAAPVTQPAAEETEAPEVKPEDITGTLTYWTYTDNAFQLTNEFAKKYPNVTIDVQVFGGDEYKTKILTALQDGTNVPDIFDLEEGYVYEFLDSSIIADLSYMNIEALTADYYNFQIASMKDSKGNFKCLSFQSNPVCFWYLRDAAEQWLGTSDPAEISNMITSWEDMMELQEKVWAESGETVTVFPTMAEMPKVSAFSFDPLVQNGELVISEDWVGLIDDMRAMYNTEATEYPSWSGEWASAWNEGKLIFRTMPSWDFFTDWEKNNGNVGLAVPFKASFEGLTCLCVYDKTEKKDLAALFLEFVASDEFQIANMEINNQVPASRTAINTMAEGHSDPKFGGQNLIATLGEVLEKVEAITPDKYTRAVQNLFQSTCSNGIKNGLDNDAIIAEFKAALADQYPEVVIK